jgi:HEPN domain-containing protein
MKFIEKEDFEKIKELEDKALEINQEAQRLHQKCSYDLAVRRSQEAFELYLKFIFRLFGKETKEIWGHELTILIDKETPKIRGILKEYLKFSETYIDEIIARIKLGGLTLKLWRDPAFYGDENLKKFKYFNEKESALALNYVEEVFRLSNWLRNYFYQKFY